MHAIEKSSAPTPPLRTRMHLTSTRRACTRAKSSEPPRRARCIPLPQTDLHLCTPTRTSSGPPRLVSPSSTGAFHFNTTGIHPCTRTQVSSEPPPFDTGTSDFNTTECTRARRRKSRSNLWSRASLPVRHGRAGLKREGMNSCTRRKHRVSLLIGRVCIRLERGVLHSCHTRNLQVSLPAGRASDSNAAACTDARQTKPSNGPPRRGDGAPVSNATAHPLARTKRSP